MGGTIALWSLNAALILYMGSRPGVLAPWCGMLAPIGIAAGLTCAALRIARRDTRTLFAVHPLLWIPPALIVLACAILALWTPAWIRQFATGAQLQFMLPVILVGVLPLLVLSVRALSRRPAPQTVTVASTANPFAAEYLRNALQASGIRCMLDGALQAGYAGVLPIRLIVRASDAIRARSIIDRLEIRKPPEPCERKKY